MLHENGDWSILKLMGTRTNLIKEKKRARLEAAIPYLVSLLLILATLVTLFIVVPRLSRAFEVGASKKGSPPSATQPLKSEIRIMAVGDVMFDRKVKALIEKEGPLIPLSGVKEILSQADLNLANLESPLASWGVKLKDKDVTFRGDIRGAKGMDEAGARPSFWILLSMKERPERSS